MGIMGKAREHELLLNQLIVGEVEVDRVSVDERRERERRWGQWLWGNGNAKNAKCSDLVDANNSNNEIQSNSMDVDTGGSGEAFWDNENQDGMEEEDETNVGGGGNNNEGSMVGWAKRKIGSWFSTESEEEEEMTYNYDYGSSGREDEDNSGSLRNSKRRKVSATYVAPPWMANQDDDLD